MAPLSFEEASKDKGMVPKNNVLKLKSMKPFKVY